MDARLFPDGKTVHLPSNNQPLARYDEARAEIEARGGAAASVPAERKSKSFLAFLFGGGEEDEDAGVVAAPPNARKQWASLAPRGAQSARADADEEGAAAPPAEKPGRRGRVEKIAEAESNLPRGETTLSPGPSESKTDRNAAAPLPPAREDRSAPLAVAALEPAAGEAKLVADLPLPPRRPIGLLAWAAPLPPTRPTELASLAAGVAGAAPFPAAGQIAAASANALKARGTNAGGAIASLIDVTGTTPLANEAGLRGSTPVEASAAKPEPLLAYAPGAAAPASGKDAPAETPASARIAAATKPPLAKPAAIQRAEFVPARLDRSNFHAMTAAIPTSRMAAGSVLGSTLSGPRSAARAEPNLFVAAPETNYASAFAAKANVLPTDRFVSGR